MEASKGLTAVNIQPDIGILSLLRHLNYRPWFALAEFVDNSLQSFMDHKDDIEAVERTPAKLRLEIEINPYDGGAIIIRDNAAGIYESEYQRAFRPAAPPPDIGGLCEFGMGMKSAACWFGRSFIVRSSALGESLQRTVSFDIEDVLRQRSGMLPVQLSTAPAEQHFTEVVLFNLHKTPQGRTIAKIREHLASIYRVFTRDGTLELHFRFAGSDELLVYDDPEVLFAPPDDKVMRRRILSLEPRLWRKEIKFDFGVGLRVNGFAALRKRGSTAKAGFALFRRNRLIEGSGEDSYRPQAIFGATTTAIYQRLFGELHLDGFEVSHTKDGFKWDENEEPFLELLKEELNADPMPLLDQAKEASYDSLRGTKADVEKAIQEAVKDTVEVLKERAAPVLEEQIESKPEMRDLPASLPHAHELWGEVFDVDLHGLKWQIDVEVSNDPSIGPWVSASDTGSGRCTTSAESVRRLAVRLSLAHPFMTRFVGADLDRIKPFVRIAAAIGLAEITARETGVRNAGEITRNINQLLRDALSRS